MNKKISTLFAAAMLASAFTVNAGVYVGDAVSKLAIGNNEKLYQLQLNSVGSTTETAERVLALDEDGKILIENAQTVTLGTSLWCVNVQKQNQGQNPIFDFTNKSFGYVLDVTADGYKNWSKDANGLYTSTTAEVGGEVAGWQFAPVLDQLTQKCYLASYINSNDVAVLAIESGKVVVKIVAADKVNETNVEGLLKFTLVEAAHRVLSANDFNTKLGVQNDSNSDATVKLSFHKDYNNTKLVNPFSSNELRAEAITGTDAEFVYLYRTNEDGKKQYLRVDTAYANSVGEKFLNFAFGKEDVAPAGMLLDQYKFRMTYCSTEDSLYIQVKNAYMKPDDVEYWKDLTAVTHQTVNDTKKNNWVKLQDLVVADESRIVTIGEQPINTKISLGIGGCTAYKSVKTSVADDVYFIKNRKGEYLASPIYENGTIRWTTVNADEQNVEHMPAYQWVVLKHNTSSTVAETSKVEITNREFEAKTASNIQLNKKEGASWMYVGSTIAFGGTNLITSADSLEFIPVSAAAKADSLLGYKKLDNDSLLVNKYTFNYWHPYADNKFISKSSKDSTLIVLDDKDGFKVDTVSYNWNTTNASTVNIPYGYDKKVGFDRIKGLKRLHRTAYEISLDKAAWMINKEDKFNVSEYSNGIQKSNYVPVFFKENNQFGDKCYHAIVMASRTNADADFEIVDGTVKAGVSDYDGSATLKSQVLDESRTSAFYIAPDNTPLYRRFSSLELEGNEGDKADTLRFIEKYRKEYLQVENNKNFMKEGIDFLGIYTPDKTEDGLSFIVDTAWVNRGSGNIKPQYLISIDRNDFEGVEGVPCTEDDHHFTAEGKPTDKWHCVHAKPAVPGFERGKYLINFHDFANKYGWSTLSNGEQDADYMWKKYDRAGFVEAIRVADTLYILRDEFKNLPNEKINFADLNKAEEDAWTAAKKAGVSEDEFVSHKYILSGDNHKYVTWSMRFVNKEVAANEVEADRAFLFESMKSKHVSGYNNSAMGDIAPTYAAWLRMQNGCLVLSDDRSSNFDEMNTGGDDALIFNVEQGDDIATDNETIDAVEGISVVAGNGTVTVQGAAGKSVVITNILGKVIAETVLTSDNATISVPAGIVAVAVDGEEAVKAIVK